MRKEPSNRSEMVNQLLKGDTFHIIEHQEKWSLIECDYDGYHGWVDNKQWIPVHSGAAIAVDMCNESTSPSQVANQVYLGAPYMWGGRTAMGIDCSGLTQVCFKACGIRLLRDASQQATQGELVSFEKMQIDDLCFFSNPEGRIIHVGIILGENHIIHSCGMVRIDRLDNIGIYNEQKADYTHHLHSIRRVNKSIDERIM